MKLSDDVIGISISHNDIDFLSTEMVFGFSSFSSSFSV